MAGFEHFVSYWKYHDGRARSGGGLGKWKLATCHPLQVFNDVRDAITHGKLADVTLMKTRSVPEKRVETVYVYTGPYSDADKVAGIAEALWDEAQKRNWKLEDDLQFKTDLQTFWQKATDAPAGDDGRPSAWNGRPWLYLFDGQQFTMNGNMMRWHERLENCHATGDPAATRLRRQIPDDRVFVSGNTVGIYDELRSQNDWIVVLDP